MRRKDDLFKAESANPIQDKRSKRPRPSGVGRFMFSGGRVQTQQLLQREDWRRRREKYLRESGRQIELIKEGYECEDSSKDWAVIVGRGERTALMRHAPGARLFVVRRDLTLAQAGANVSHA
jgi:hypothetical protein